MDEITDSIGKLSTTAKEWKPGQSFTSTSKVTSSSSPWGNPNAPSFRAALSSSSSSHGGAGDQKVKPSQGSFAWDPSKTKEFVPQSARVSQQQQPQPQPQQRFQDPSSEQMHNVTAGEQMTHTATSSTTLPAATAVASHPAQTFTSNNPLTQPMHKTIHSLGLPNHTLWSIYRSIALDCAKEMEPNDARYKAIPPQFVNATPLEESIQNNSSVGSGINGTTSSSNANITNPNASQTLIRSSFGYHTSIFKVTSTEDGRLYCLRRFDNVKGTNQKIANTVTNEWTRAMIKRKKGNESGSGKPVLQHPGIVRFVKCFYQVCSREMV